MLDMTLLGAGFGLVVASSSMGDKISKGSPLLRPLNPLLMNVITGIAALAGFVAMVGGFFLYGWIWLLVMLGAIIIMALLFVVVPRTPIIAMASGTLGTALLIAGWATT